MKKQKNASLLFIITAIIFVYAIIVISNHFKASYEALNKTDQAVLSELNTFFSAEQKEPLWTDYQLSDHTILAINTDGLLHHAYLINPQKEVDNLFVKKIYLPTDFSIDVYRICAVSPQMIQFLFPSNFNSLGIDYTVYDNSVYFTKFSEASFAKKYDSFHYITFLSHEAFHYYMQNDWAGGERFNTSLLTENDLDLMIPLYKVYDELLKELRKESVDKETLTALAKQYVALSEKRYEANPAYMKAESLTETAEGTATYIGLRASKIVGYDFDIMTMSTADNKKIELPVSSIIPTLKEKNLDKSVIASDLVYSTGALLCELLDALEVPDWQKKLNLQTKETPITLFDILSNWIC